MTVPATTVRDLIVGALVDSGAFGRGMPPSADAVNAGLQRLNWMISQWGRKRWIVYRLAEYSIMSDGSESYTVGPGGQIDIPVRPNAIEYAFMRQTLNITPDNPVDYPLMMINSHEDYSRVTLKKLKSWPEAVFYDPVLPLGVIKTVPVLQASYELFFGIKQVLSRYGSLNDVLGLPEEYEAALYYNLLIRVGAKYRIAQDPVNVALAKDGLNVLREANNAISTLQMPHALAIRNGDYNIYSDDN